MLDQVLHLDRRIEGDIGKRRVQRAGEPERMSRAVQEVGVAERDVACARRDLGPDVGHHHRFRHDAEAPLVHRHHRAVAAEMLAAAAAFGEARDALRAIGQDQLRIAGKRGQPRAIGCDERNLCETYGCLSSRRDGVTVAQTLGQIEQRRFELAAENAAGAPRTQERLVHGGIETVDAEMGAGCELAHLGQGFDGDPRGGMHADAERDQTRPGELARGEFVQREVDALDVEACPREPSGRGRERERLAAELVGVDQDDFEALRKVRGACGGRRRFGSDAGIAHGLLPRFDSAPRT